MTDNSEIDKLGNSEGDIEENTENVFEESSEKDYNKNSNDNNLKSNKEFIQSIKEFIQSNKEFIQSNKEFIQSDYKSIKDEILQLKNGQIMIITAATSATGIILSFLVNNYSQITSPNYFSELLFFLPLLIILPSFAICIHKSTLINIKMGYLNRLGMHLSGYENISLYLGYGNYSEEWYDSYDKFVADENDGLGINDLKLFDKKKVENKIDGKVGKLNKKLIKYKFEKFLYVIYLDIIYYFSICADIMKNFLDNCRLIFQFNQKNRYWSLIISIYLCLVIVCYLFPLFHIIQYNGIECLSHQPIFYILIVVSSLFIFIYAIGRILWFGKAFWGLLYIVFSILFINYMIIQLGLSLNELIIIILGAIMGTFIKKIISYLDPRRKNKEFKCNSNTETEVHEQKNMKPWVLLFIIIDIIISLSILLNYPIDITKTDNLFLSGIYIISIATISIGFWGFINIYNMAFGKAKVTKLEKIWKNIIAEKNKDYPRFEVD